MRTQRKLTSKVLFFALLSTFLLVGCGQDNKSGSSSSSSKKSVTGIGGTTNVGNGSSYPDNWFSSLLNEVSCNTVSNTNSRVKIELQNPGININVNSLHAGVTIEGDIIVMSNDGSGPQIELHVCERSGMQSQAQLIEAPVLNTSSWCALGEVTKTNVLVGGQYGNFGLAFFPLDLYPQRLSLCN